ncbi:MAG: DUF3392 domain-containing protein [Pseudomonas sp.]
MDYLLDLIVNLSHWCRAHLYDISLAIMASLFVLFGPGMNRWVQRSIGRLNFFMRTLIFVLVCAFGYGLAMILATPWLVQGLGQLNNYSLAPALLLVFFMIGVMADRS